MTGILGWITRTLQETNQHNPSFILWVAAWRDPIRNLWCSDFKKQNTSLDPNEKMWFVKRDAHTGLQVIPTCKQDIKCNMVANNQYIHPNNQPEPRYSLLLWNLKLSPKVSISRWSSTIRTLPCFCKSPHPHTLSTHIGWNIGSHVFQLFV